MNHLIAALSTFRPLTFRPRLKLIALTLTVASATCLGAAPSPAIKIVNGAIQKTTYASSFATPLTVQVTDSKTRLALPGYTVAFTPGVGVALTSPSATTDKNGMATVNGKGIAAGTYTVVATVSGYAASVTFTSMIVNKVALTILPANVTSIIGVIPTFTAYSLNGFVNSESAASAHVQGAPALTTVATLKSIAGTYGLKSAVGTLTAANYSFAGTAGTLTLAGLPPCGIPEGNASYWLKGTYAFNLYNQQGGYTGTMTADGVSKIQGSAILNQSNSAEPVETSFSGTFQIGTGARGGAVTLQTTAGSNAGPVVSSLCMSLDHVVNGVATSGRLIAANNAGVAEAGSFYLVDGSVTSMASLQGTYVVSLQGSSLDVHTATSLRSIATGAIMLDGNGNITSGLADMEDMTMGSGTAVEEYSAKIPVTGNYTYDPTIGGGLLNLSYSGQQVQIAFVAPTRQHLLLMTNDKATNIPGGSSSTEPLYFGDGRLRATGTMSAAMLKGDLNMRLQGLDPTALSGTGASNPIGVIAEAGGFAFDGVSTFKAQGLFNTLDGIYLTTLDYSVIQSTLTYTVDPTTGRFESLDYLTDSCVVCGYIVNANEIDTVVTQTGLPLLATFETAATAPGKTKIGDLNGAYSTGSMALISPQVSAWEGALHFDGKGNFHWSSDEETVGVGLATNFGLYGTYTAVSDSYALTLFGDSSPDFYLYLDASGRGSVIPANLANTYTLPMLDLNYVNIPN
jgi:hypothetical protein